MLQFWLEIECQWAVLNRQHYVFTPGSLEGGSFLYGSDSLAVQEAAQCPNLNGVTCSQD